MKSIKVILIDDNDPFRMALKNVLVNKFAVDIIGEASNGANFQKLTNLHLSDVILMDIMMPDTDGITLTKKALWTLPSLKFIAITMHYDKVYLTTLMGAGFRGCVFKSNIFSEIAEAIHTVVEGRLYFPKDILLDTQKHRT
jgi:DNA-binding NarL/FixJ family response regulator